MSEEFNDELDESLFDCEECGEPMDECECDDEDFDMDEEDWEDS